MSFQLPNHYVQQYTTNVGLLLQQKGSMLRGSVGEGQYYGRQAAVVDQYGTVEAQERFGKYEPNVPLDLNVDRRWVAPRTFDVLLLEDKQDKLRMLNDPRSSYVQSASASLGRAMDDMIISAFFGDAKTGVDGGSTELWSSFSATQVVSASEGAAAATGLNVAKLLKAREILRANQVDFDNDQLIVVLTAKQETNLLKEALYIKDDYGTPVMDSGKIKSYLGFDFVYCERLTLNGSSQYRVPAYAKSGIHLGIFDDVSADIRQRPDIRGLPWQIYTEGTFNATRTEAKKVVEIPCA